MRTERITTRQYAIRLARRVWDDGRTAQQHVEIVWANFCDYFTDQEEYLTLVAGCDGQATPVTSAALYMLRQATAYRWN